MANWIKLSLLSVALSAACSSPTVSLTTGGSGGMATNGSGGSSTNAQTTATQATAGVGTTSTTKASTNATNGVTTAATTNATTSTGTSMLDQARITCINKINQLRATKGLPPYTRWMSAETCVDQEATKDEQTNMPHGAWISGAYPCNGNAQNECLGQGVAGISQCLQQMWDERLQPNCTGCDACMGAYTPNCPSCDYYGQQGPECGHYVNMSALWLTQAACGFSSLGGWDAINFK
jgi:hypothetical protein